MVHEVERGCATPKASVIAAKLLLEWRVTS